ncbi:MAG: flagellar export protein FliJ [Phenylobacterium sp.]|jgi:flagellar FliJ protein|uniref:flagellar export protein FliJ n=1 Tax=Phenylobacterium sp. TaxID=1871053 RepID=UPI002A365942|nr:flagellar export protein FliJ [Phenylobacterium sp.]MDX9996873.1 flagellar export protein FliJ [Phenylobacterium sp.]
MNWTKSLIRISTYQVEEHQKRLAEIADRRRAVEARLLELAAEAVAESQASQADAEGGWYKAGWLEGLRVRKAELHAQLAAIQQEEAGARDILAEAFEEQKKYEQVAENMRLAAARERARREGAVLDELGLRAAAGR